MNKYSTMMNNSDQLSRMLVETDQRERKFLTDEERKALTDSIVESYLCESQQTQILEGMIGVKYYTDLELINERLESTYPVSDEEWDGCDTYPFIEVAVDRTIKLLINEVKK